MTFLFIFPFFLMSEKKMILYVLEPFCKWTQRYFNCDCFAWSAIFFIFSIGLNFFGILEILKAKSIDTSALLWHFWIGVIAVGMLNNGLEIAGKTAYRCAEQNLKNPLLRASRFSRIFLFVDLIYCAGRFFLADHARHPLIISLPQLSFWLASAFAACTPDFPKEERDAVPSTA